MSTTDYRIWNYVKAEHQAIDRYTTPFYLNYTDIGIMNTRLIERVWTVMGLVVQSVYYANYNPQKNEYSNPVIYERWNWVLDPNTKFAIARIINAKGFADTEQPTLIANVNNNSTTVKYYPTYSDQIAEISRRHQNVINNVKETVLKTLVMTETRGNLVTAIALGTKFIEAMNPYIQAYVTDGSPLLANISRTAEVRNKFVWLDNDMTVMGYPGKRLWEILFNMLKLNVIEKLNEIDYDELFLQI